MILATGASGEVGSRVVEGLLAGGQPLRVFTRGSDDWRGTSVAGLRDRGAETILADIRDPNMVNRAVTGCKAVINMSGILRRSADCAFEDVHVDGVRNLVAAAEGAGVQRFIHMSCLTASGGESAYGESRRQGEEIVKAGRFHWTIFRPSYIFGDRFALLEMVAPLLVKPPVVPVVGGGLNIIQPIHADDVAACVLQSIYSRDTAGQVYDLVGPDRVSILQLFQSALKVLADGGKEKPTITVPTAVALKAVRVTGRVLPAVPITADVLEHLISDSVADPMPMLTSFKVAMRPLSESMDRLTKSVG